MHPHGIGNVKDPRTFRPAELHHFNDLPVSPISWYHAIGASRDSVCSALLAQGLAEQPDVDSALQTICDAGFLPDYPRERKQSVSVVGNLQSGPICLFRDAGAWPADDDTPEVELVEFRHSTLPPSESSIDLASSKLTAGATRQMRSTEWISEDLDGPSVNGKLLSDPAIQKACRMCYDDAIRKSVRENGTSDVQLLRVQRQGLWLECLVADICLRHSMHVWVGQMIGLFEVDVLAAIDGQRILFECKDTSLGQNDFIVALKKAHSIGVDLLVLIASKPFHANVLRAIKEELARAEEAGDATIIPVVHAYFDTAQSLVVDLTTFLNELRALTVYHWLSFDHTSAAAPWFFDVGDPATDA